MMRTYGHTPAPEFRFPTYYPSILHRNAESIQLVEFNTVVIKTGADNFVLKLARVPDAPAPVFPYSAKVTWSVLCERRQCCAHKQTQTAPQEHLLRIAKVIKTAKRLGGGRAVRVH